MTYSVWCVLRGEDGHTPVHVSYEEFVQQGPVTIARTALSHPRTEKVAVVSTVFGGFDHAFLDGDPRRLFETVNFLDADPLGSSYSDTWDDALRTHAETVALHVEQGWAVVGQEQGQVVDPGQ